MAIEFHCNHCGKQVRAPDEAGGKHGRCPTCHQSVYIPMPDDQIELIDLAPIDKDREREAERARRESEALQRKILHEKNLPPETAGSARPVAGGFAPPAVDVEDTVIGFAKAMAEGRLSEAEELAASARRHPRELNDVVQRITSDEIPPDALASIPRPVLLAFLRQLVEKKH